MSSSDSSPLHEVGGQGAEQSTARVWQEHRQTVEVEEETLQGKRPVPPASGPDEDTLNDADVRWNLRGRRIPSLS